MKRSTGLAIVLTLASLLLVASSADAGVRFGIAVGSCPPPGAVLVMRTHRPPTWARWYRHWYPGYRHNIWRRGDWMYGRPHRIRVHGHDGRFH